mmetsp:Transcript_140657/g.242964  ORF Transcript_140657/g.242964 Transcript_140657/m.242964 type:complete len:202 (+) Transcript_140657:78-683(+)
MAPVLFLLCASAARCAAGTATVAITGTMRREPYSRGVLPHFSGHAMAGPQQAQPMSEVEEEAAGSNFGFHENTFKDLFKVRQGFGSRQDSRDARLQYALQVDAEQAKRAEEEDRENRQRLKERQRAAREDARRRLMEEDFKWTQEEQAPAEDEERDFQEDGLRPRPRQGWSQPIPQGPPDIDVNNNSTDQQQESTPPAPSA